MDGYEDQFREIYGDELTEEILRRTSGMRNCLFWEKERKVGRDDQAIAYEIALLEPRESYVDWFLRKFQKERWHYMHDSFVKACQAFFSTPPFARKVDIPEFKSLSTQDKIELSAMLNEIPGFEHPQYEPKPAGAPGV